MVHDVRVAPFSELSTLAVSSWNGQSRASWEGETLLIKTSGLRDYTTRIGTSDEMSIEERFTLLDVDSLSYTYTVNDPKVFTAPWTARQTLKRLNGQIYEYACHEGNESLSAMLRGSRLSDDSR
jgi:hypothetical protein